MALQYYTVPNQMTADPDDHMAITLSSLVSTLDDLFDDMTDEGSTVTRAEARAFWEMLRRALVRRLSNGGSVNTDIFKIKAVVSGIFPNGDAAFNKSRNRVRLRVSLGSLLREIEETIPVEKVATREIAPTLLHYYNHENDSTDDLVTTGGGARITGTLLKVDESDPEQGIFFINTATAAVVKVPGKLLKNKPGELIFSNPSAALLPAGTYWLEVRTRLNGTPNLRVGTLADDLTV